MLIPISDLSIFVSNSTWSVYRFTIRSARRLVRSRTQGQQVDRPVSRWVGWSADWQVVGRVVGPVGWQVGQQSWEITYAYTHYTHYN